jgi:putative membrane protein
MFTRILMAWAASTISLLIVAHVLPGFRVANLQSALIAAVVLGFINGTLGAIIKFFMFPIRLLTLGLASLVINALMLILATQLVQGFKVDGFVPAFLGSILVSVSNWLIREVLPDGKGKQKED